MINVNYSIDNLFDTIYDEVRDIVLSINDAKCSTCGGAFLDSACKYCNNIDNNVEALIGKLNSKIIEAEQILSNNKITDVPLNKLFNALIILRFRNISKVDEILNKFNYKRKFDLKFDEIHDKMMRGAELDAMEIDISEKIITGNLYHSQLIVLYNYFISATIKGQQNVNYECFEMLIKKFCEHNMQGVFRVVNCGISDDLEENECGNIINGTKMQLNRGIIREFYERRNIELIYTISHELEHVKQHRRLFVDNLIGDYIFLELKENLIQKFDNNYYRDNYANITFEKEAWYFEKFNGIEYLKSIGFPIEMPESYKEQLKELEENLYNQERIYNGEITTLEEVFCATVYNHPEVLSESGYKKLGMFYKVVENKVIPKSPLELRNELEEMLNNCNNEQEREVISKLYNDHIESSIKYYGDEEMTRR